MGPGRHRRCPEVYARRSPGRPGSLPGMVPGRGAAGVARVLAADRAGQLPGVPPGSHPGRRLGSGGCVSSNHGRSRTCSP